MTDFRQQYEKDIKKEKQNSQPKEALVKDLSQQLKDWLQEEIDQLPEYLSELEPKDRLNFVAKLIPYIMPKVEKVHPQKWETNSFGGPIF